MCTRGSCRIITACKENEFEAIRRNAIHIQTQVTRRCAWDPLSAPASGVHQYAFLQMILFICTKTCTAGRPKAASGKIIVYLFFNLESLARCETISDREFPPEEVADNSPTPAPRSETLFSCHKMGSATPAKSSPNPWIETPLVESSVLSKAAGWYGGLS